MERRDLAIGSVATPFGGEDALKSALKAGLGLDLPARAFSTTSPDILAIRTAPDQMLQLFAYDTPDAEPFIASKRQGTGHTTDQTDVWLAFDISGLANSSARTVMKHMDAMILHTVGDQFPLVSASLSATSFLHAVETSFHNVL